MNVSGYSRGVAIVFDELWGSYSDWFAKQLQNILTFEFNLQTGRLLDVGCGAGRFVDSFHQNSWKIFGVDPSEAMLQSALGRFDLQDVCRFELGHLANFGIEGQFDVITCIYDTLNHARNMEDVEDFFAQCAKHTSAEGVVVFDYNTSRGLEDWNRIKIVEKSNVLLVSRGIFLANEQKAYRRFSGFCMIDDKWVRFEENIHNIVITIESIRALAYKYNFDIVRFSSIKDMSKPSESPEDEDRIVTFLKRKA
jgi:SAM-dependent methyltransferase